MEKKSLLFVVYGMGIGGIEKCLVNLLNVLPEERYDVDLLVIDPIYDLLPQIRRQYHMVDAFEYTLNTEITMQEIRKRGGIFRHLNKLIPYIDHRIRIKLGLPLWTTFKPVEKNYDIAVAYSQNGLGPYYMMDKVTARRKVLWYHNGAYERTGKNYARDQKYYPLFDQVVAVSQDCANILLKCFPELREKILVLHNICDAKSIREKAAAFVPETYCPEICHIVTVGRLSREKGAYLALEACKILREEGRDFCWHWIGDGDQAEEIRRKRDELQLQKVFLLEGNQQNPYPYIANAAIYVQPSLYEAYSTTVTEARVLQRPIVATDVGGMHDQLRQGKTGTIVPLTSEAIADGVRTLMEKKELRTAYREALAGEDFCAETVLKEYERTVFA